MKKRVTALVCAAAIILGGFIAAPDVRAEEILFISTGYFKRNMEILFYKRKISPIVYYLGKLDETLLSLI